MVNKVITSVLVMLTIWCTCNSANSGNLLTKVNEYRVEIHQFQRQVASLIDRLDALEQQDFRNEIEVPETLSRINE